MDKKDFIFPGVIFALVVVIGIGLLATHADKPALVTNTFGTTTNQTASSSVSEPSPGTAPTVSASHTAPSAPSTPAPSAYYPYGSVTLALGQAAGFKDGVSIRPMRVLEDSRCPMGVMCIQAGTVRVSVKVDGNGTEKEERLTLGHSIQVGSDTVTLDSVDPQRSKDGYPEPSSYRFTFSVKHG